MERLDFSRTKWSDMSQRTFSVTLLLYKDDGASVCSLYFRKVVAVRFKCERCSQEFLREELLKGHYSACDFKIPRILLDLGLVSFPSRDDGMENQARVLTSHQNSAKDTLDDSSLKETEEFLEASVCDKNILSNKKEIAENVNLTKDTLCKEHCELNDSSPSIKNPKGSQIIQGVENMDFSDRVSEKQALLLPAWLPNSEHHGNSKHNDDFVPGDNSESGLASNQEEKPEDKEFYVVANEDEQSDLPVQYVKENIFQLDLLESDSSVKDSMEVHVDKAAGQQGEDIPPAHKQRLVDMGASQQGEDILLVHTERPGPVRLRVEHCYSKFGAQGNVNVEECKNVGVQFDKAPRRSRRRKCIKAGYRVSNAWTDEKEDFVKEVSKAAQRKKRNRIGKGAVRLRKMLKSKITEEKIKSDGDKETVLWKKRNRIGKGAVRLPKVLKSKITKDKRNSEDVKNETVDAVIGLEGKAAKDCTNEPSDRSINDCKELSSNMDHRESESAIDSVGIKTEPAKKKPKKPWKPPERMCHQCGQIMCTAYSLKLHLLVHASIKNFTCPECNKRFTHKQGYETHMKKHRGQRDYLCTVCGMTFLRNGDRQQHMMTHEEHTPVKCTQCDKTFKNERSLMYHMRIHNDERRYSCDICGLKFVHNGTCRIHRLSHTGEKPYPCSICGKGFTTSNKLKRHQEIHERKNKSADNFLNYECFNIIPISQNLIAEEINLIW